MPQKECLLCTGTCIVLGGKEQFHKNKTFVLIQKKCFYSLQLDVSTLDQVEWYGACGGLSPCCCLRYAVYPNEQEVSGHSQSKIKLHLH